MDPSLFEGDNFKVLLDIKDIIQYVSISTITVQCYVKVIFDSLNIFKYIDLEKGCIDSAKYANCFRTGDNIFLDNNTSKKRTKKIKTFYNQVTLEINKNKVKIFDNGTLHITGCKGYDNIIHVINILCKELNKKKGLLTPYGVEYINYYSFIGDRDNLSEGLNLNDMIDFKINLINCGFDLDFDIDRIKLYKLLYDEGTDCVCDLDLHACVNIKFECSDYDIMKNISPEKNKVVSIFIFGSGSIIITGGTTKNHIEQAYNYIIKKIFKHYNEIIHISINDLDVQNIG